jgi:uncharacterized protein
MLEIEIGQIPPEGMDVDAALEAADVQLEAEGEFRLFPGGRITCHIDRTDDGSIHIRGRLVAEISLSCSRCLENYSLPVPSGLDLFFLQETPGARNEAEEEVELSDRDMVIAYYSGDRLRLSEMVREQVVLSVPMKPLCGDLCRGRCPMCGANRNTASCSCPATEDVDSRLSILKKLLNPESH